MASYDKLRGTVVGGLSLLAFGLGACGEQPQEEVASDRSDLATTNGLAGINGLSTANGLAGINGLSTANGLAGINGLSTANGLAGINGLSTTNGLMTTAPGRSTVEYLVRCALPAGTNLVKQDQNGASYTFPGSLGLAPGWQTGACDQQCQEYVSACMMAHINTAGVHIPLWIVAQAPSVGWSLDPNYPNQEGSFFGNIFTTGAHGVGTGKVAAFYCNGMAYNVDTVPGRIGANQVGAPYTDPFIVGPYETGTTGYCADVCTAADYPNSANGYKACAGWNYVVTTYRQATTGGTITSTPTTGAAAGLTATISEYDQTKKGYCANINVKNNTSSTVGSWTVSYDVGVAKTQSQWGAHETATGSVHTAHVTDMPLGPGMTRSIGYCTQYDGNKAVAPSIKSVSAN